MLILIVKIFALNLLLTITLSRITMPISDEIRSNKVDYKQKYSNLKRKLKILIYVSILNVSLN